MEIIASGIGGYVAGRLRTKWVNVHTDEVYFRDTVHGFLVWAVGLVVTAAFLTSAASSMVGGPATAGTSTGVVAAEGNVDPNEYFIDTLFRTNLPSADRNDAPMREEVEVILVNAMRHGELPAADKSYLVKLVTSNTGVSETEAENRIAQAFDGAR